MRRLTGRGWLAHLRSLPQGEEWGRGRQMRPGLFPAPWAAELRGWAGVSEESPGVAPGQQAWVGLESGSASGLEEWAGLGVRPRRQA
ncbi:hypothetical protein [Deinococcus apachensis]|uniref:hypothetical protein n=1 Tax=Deinococcus apachensis TaxID=309886 RepID=UPI00036DC887|nr:hypothetical protein [Deinococcus apachensis]